MDRDRRDSPYQRREQCKNTPQRPQSRARSTTSLQSEISVNSNQSGQSKRPRSGSQQLRKDSRLSEDRFDPFSFIQPVPEPFSRKVKKTLGPIFGILLLLILAASLGAAIYFAVELKSKCYPTFAIYVYFYKVVMKITNVHKVTNEAYKCLLRYIEMLPMSIRLSIKV